MRIIRGKLILKYYLIRNIYMHNGHVRAYFFDVFYKVFRCYVSISFYVKIPSFIDIFTK